MSNKFILRATTKVRLPLADHAVPCSLSSLVQIMFVFEIYELSTASWKRCSLIIDSR